MDEAHRQRIAEALRRRYAEGKSHLQQFQKAGQDHPGWKGGTSGRSYRRRAFAAYGAICHLCGASHAGLVVAHKDGCKENAELTNLEVRCRRCHERAKAKFGADNPAFTTGIGWRYYRRVAFTAYGRACQRCGGAAHLVVHHRDRDRHNNEVSNLEVLCRSCHNTEHGIGEGRRAR